MDRLLYSKGKKVRQSKTDRKEENGGDRGIKITINSHPAKLGRGTENERRKTRECIHDISRAKKTHTATKERWKRGDRERE